MGDDLGVTTVAPRMSTEKQDLAIAAARSAPAVAGSWFAGATPNEQAGFVVALVTIVYIVVQCAYLIRKWIREESEWGKRVKKAKDTVSGSLF